MNQKSSNSIQTALLLVLVLLSAFQIAFMAGAIPNFSASTSKTTTEWTNSSGLEQVVREALLKHEYEKVWGKANYDVINEVQKVFLSHPSNPNNIAAQKEILEHLKGDSTATTDTHTNTNTQWSSNTLSSDEIANILKDAVLEGNTDAPIVAIEYADFECPYCVRQHNDNKITQTLKEEYPDKVTTAFKNHRGVDHSGTEIKALAALCAEKVGGNESYLKFYKAIFAGSTTSSYYQVSKLPELAKEVGLDVAKWQSCVDNKETLAQFEAETAEAKKYGMSGTPGTLIFNKNTGKYGVVKGAYGYDTFKSLVNSLLAE